jgi:hypothetical protein
LNDIAAGAPASPRLAAHIAGCADCRGRLARLRDLLATANSQLAQVASAQPSRDFTTRIRTAVAAQAHAAPWRAKWLWPSLAVATAAGVALLLVATREPPMTATAQRPAPLPYASSSAPAAQPEPEARASVPAPRATPRQAHAKQRAGSPREPEVLVPAGSYEALLQVVVMATTTGNAPPMLAASGQPSGPMPELPPLEIKPVEIVPLEPTATSGT